jgi:hypothetical protein
MGHAKKERVLLVGTDQRITSGPAATAAASRRGVIFHATTGRIYGCTRTLRRKVRFLLHRGRRPYMAQSGGSRRRSNSVAVGAVADIVRRTAPTRASLMTRMYGPAVRCKRVSSIRRICGLASMYPASDWSACAPGHHGYQRACDLFSGQASNGPFGSPVFACAGKTEPPSRLILSQTSAGRCNATVW